MSQRTSTPLRTDGTIQKTDLYALPPVRCQEGQIGRIVLLNAMSMMACHLHLRRLVRTEAVAVVMGREDLSSGLTLGRLHQQTAVLQHHEATGGKARLPHVRLQPCKAVPG